MPHRVEIGSKADAQLAALDAAIGISVERKIQWLAENAAAIVHRRLVGMPKDLGGLCKLRVGDYRILYWNYPAQKLVRIYRIQHRSEVYRSFK
jgi:mRNA-degrading endonuclease RelE of RelBE toxin-antitoxin system